MYTSDQFIEQAKAYTQTDVSPETVSELKAISDSLDDLPSAIENWKSLTGDHAGWLDMLKWHPSNKETNYRRIAIRWLDKQLIGVARSFVNDEQIIMQTTDPDCTFRISAMTWTGEASLSAHVSRLASENRVSAFVTPTSRCCIFLIIEFLEHHEILTYPRTYNLSKVARFYGANLDFIAGYIIRDEFIPLRIDVPDEVLKQLKGESGGVSGSSSGTLF
jgi:hypothetical protein